MDLLKKIGFSLDNTGVKARDERVIQYINLKLTALGYPAYGRQTDEDLIEIAKPLLHNHREKNRLLSNYFSAADKRIQDFLDDYLKDVQEKTPARLPANSLILDRHGLARTMSLPPDQDSFTSDIVSSYRVKQGVLHNPRSDRRTTQGVFHVAEGGFPIPEDKKAVPKLTFRRLLTAALNPPAKLMRLPFTSTQEKQAELFVSLLMRPIVCPEIPGFMPQKSMEVRFFAPGNLVSNLDFVESIFGNAGDPFLPENDAGLDSEHWTGHTGCVILAPHLVFLKKKDLGLPSWDAATERQRRDGMCWKQEDELYNDGGAFKVTCRDGRGVIVTVIADNYFGYCKKEVKTQISYAANLYGLCEEEHAGGAIAFPSYDLGEEFSLDESLTKNDLSFDEAARLYGGFMDVLPEGYALDKNYADIVYVPSDAKFDLPEKKISWVRSGRTESIRLLTSNTYVLPSGYRIHARKQTGSHSWILIGTVAEGTLCHKPCTVSGGGKSEISKSIVDAMIQGPVFTANLHQDMDTVAEILARDYSGRFRVRPELDRPSRPILSPKRSLGSVIKLFTPSPEFTDEYNTWLTSLPPHIKDMVFVVKRYYNPDWGNGWREHFSVDMINGHPGHELKYAGRKLVANYLRVGREKDGSWRIYKVRQDFSPAQKIQAEDDITASAVVSASQLRGLNPEYKNPSVKIVINSEYRLFQRPDDAIHRGYDKQAELDLCTAPVFLSNYEPLTRYDAQELLLDAMSFDLYTEPVKKLVQEFVSDPAGDYFVVPSQPRLVDGKPSKNPRYLQNRPDLMNPRQKYLAEIGTRLVRKIPSQHPVIFPVNEVLPGRRNNPQDLKNGIPPLAVYSPIHYQELPELFMDFICSVTGKSPSTTGFGSEGALTKGPFNALWPIVDLNNALVSYIVTDYHGFTTAAGHIGPNIRVDHDISLLIPEIWSRMTVEERNPAFLIQNGYLEKISNFTYEGEEIEASILGYRITTRFAHAFLGRIFNNPNAVFSPEMLAPEKQDLRMFADGIRNIVATQKRVAENYFKDGSIEAACPPLKALLHIMVHGHFEGKDLNSPEIRSMFSRDSVLSSEWYRERLETRKNREIHLWERHLKYLKDYLKKESHAEAIEQLRLQDRMKAAKQELERVSSAAYVEALNGSIGADPFYGQLVPFPSSRELAGSGSSAPR